MDKHEALDFMKRALSDVYRKAQNENNYEVYDKSRFDEVTSLDYYIEKRLIETILEFDPKAVFLSEEYNSEAGFDKNIWIIDPIDGTCNMTHGIQTFGIQCAVCENKKPMAAAIYFPFSDEMFTAVSEEGAWLNGERIKAAARPVERSLISFGDFMRDEALFTLEKTIMNYVAERVERIRMYGAASMDFCYAACGRLDGNFTFTPNKWDIVPGYLLCKEAGLIITDVYGHPYSLEDSETIAVFATRELYEACVGWKKNRD